MPVNMFCLNKLNSKRLLKTVMSVQRYSVIISANMPMLLVMNAINKVTGIKQHEA